MGEHEGWAQPRSGLLPNGLLPGKAASVIRMLDAERWAMAEERTAELIARIQPNSPSEERRNAVASYVQGLIMECFPCQVFTFGSVPLKTYLPDGDIDLTAFSNNQNLKDSWAHLVRDMLEKEEKNEDARFRVKEVQYIQAEVKIIKCLVENIVVDISFSQLGGLCTLCFLEEVDHLINQNHLFKRSIILIKAWCYYESRILGAHHGLISTYALETLVLYIFHVFSNTFTGPLEVLYRFLEFFSKFDWDNFCVSLWGPVPISSLPDVTGSISYACLLYSGILFDFFYNQTSPPEPPRKDGGELLLSKRFLEACSSAYAVFPGGQENHGQPFVSKHFNVIDPLRVNNNLGRSVSKGNFFRIRSAFAFGAKRLARLLDCPSEDLCHEVKQFFRNTWNRHGSGHRPDAPDSEWRPLRSLNLETDPGAENVQNASGKESSDSLPGNGTEVDGPHGTHGIPAQPRNHLWESTSGRSDESISSRTNSKNSGNESSSIISDHVTQDNNFSRSGFGDSQRGSKAEAIVNNFQKKYTLARTCSSPNLTEAYTDTPSQSRHTRATESGKFHVDSARWDNSRRKSKESASVASNVRPSADSSSVTHVPLHRGLEHAAGVNSLVNSYRDDAGLDATNEDFSVVGMREMQQEEQDLVNMMASSAAHGFSGPLQHLPLNFGSSHVPFSVSPSILASMGFASRNFGGMFPANIPLIETPWGTGMQFHQGLVSSPFTHYYHGSLVSHTEAPVVSGHESVGSAELNPGEAERDFYHEQGVSAGDLDFNNSDSEANSAEDSQRLALEDSRYTQPQTSGLRHQQRFRDVQLTREDRLKEDGTDNMVYQDRVNRIPSNDRTANTRSVSVSRSSSVRSRTSSESSWEGSSARVSKPARERRGRKAVPPGVPSTFFGKGKNMVENSAAHVDDDAREWISPISREVPEKDVGPRPSDCPRVPRHQSHEPELAQTSTSNPPVPITPVILGPGAQQRAGANSGLPMFYATGPPVPFVTMLPVYKIPPSAGTSDASASHFSVEEVFDNNDLIKSLDSPEGLDQPEVSSNLNSTGRPASSEPIERKSDILNSDFLSHWQNLQYGRFCQTSPYPPPIYAPPVVVPPGYLQGRFPMDGPGRPLAPNTNILTQSMGYGPRILPIAPLQSIASGPAPVYQHYADEMPRYRSGTGTYLPNPKVAARDRHSTNTRRGSFNYDRNDHHGDREGSWNTNSKPRASGRHNRTQGDRPSSRQDRFTTTEDRADRHWGSHRHDLYPSYRAQNGPIRSNVNPGGSASVAYGKYKSASKNSSALTSDGPTIPSVVMFYPYDHSASDSPTEQLEFGSLGRMDFPVSNELSEKGHSSDALEEQRVREVTAGRSSPVQPSSPHSPRGV